VSQASPTPSGDEHRGRCAKPAGTAASGSEARDIAEDLQARILESRRSVYLVPYAAERRYYAGSVQVPEHEVSSTFGYRGGVELRREPKLSIHETGQVHVQANGSN
jgi:hypothetical protein